MEYCDGLSGNRQCPIDVVRVFDDIEVIERQGGVAEVLKIELIIALFDNVEHHGIRTGNEETWLGIGWLIVYDYLFAVEIAAELNAVFDAVKKSKRKIGKLELKLNFDSYEDSNLERVDAYVPQLREAFKRIPDADFILNPEKNAYPYQRYPNGVFVLLIYK